MDPGTWPEILRFGETVCSSLSCEAVQTRVLPDFVRLTGADSGGVYLLDHRYRTTVASVLGVSASLVYEFEEINNPRNHCPFLTRAVMTRFPVHDAMLYPTTSAHRRAPQGKLLGSYGFEHCMFSPLILNGRAIGNVSVARAINRPAFTVGEQRIAERLARFVTIALTNAVLHEAAGTPAEPSRDERTSDVETVRLADSENVAVRAAHRARATEARDVLTSREVEVLELLVSGLTNAEIGRELGIALNTVKQHVRHIYGKLGARSRVEAVRITGVARA